MFILTAVHDDCKTALQLNNFQLYHWTILKPCAEAKWRQQPIYHLLVRSNKTQTRSTERGVQQVQKHENRSKMSQVQTLNTEIYLTNFWLLGLPAPASG